MVTKTPKPMDKMLRTILLLSAALTSPFTAFAGDDMPPVSEIVQADLIAGWPTENGGHMAALRVTLAPGWKTYWRIGGETGIPPRFDWQASENLASVEMTWPRPEILEADGTIIIGYKNQLILPIELTPNAAGEMIDVAGTLQLGVCREVCMPVEFPLSGQFGQGVGKDRLLIELALADRAETAAEANLNAPHCSLLAIEDGYEFTMTLTSEQHAAREMVLFELPDKDIWIAPSQVKRNGDNLIATTAFISYAEGVLDVDLNTLRITVLTDDKAIDIQGCATG